MSTNTQYAVLVREHESAPWNLHTGTNLRPTLEAAKALWQELAAVHGVENVKILAPDGTEATGDTRPDRRVLGWLTAKLYSLADASSVPRADAERMAEYVLSTNATCSHMFHRVIHEIVTQTGEVTLYRRMEAACLEAMKPYVGSANVTEDTLHDLRQICLRTVVDMLPRGTPMPEVSLGVQAHSPAAVVLSIRRKQ